jgi:hypothetical protein
MGNTEKSASEQKMDMHASELEWVQLNQTLSKLKKMDGTNDNIETPREKLVRKVKENPFVPLGVVGTTACLVMGLFKFVKADSAGSQKMMRGRIAAQGFTVIAVVIGFGITAKESFAKSAAKLEAATEAAGTK